MALSPKKWLQRQQTTEVTSATPKHPAKKARMADSRRRSWLAPWVWESVIAYGLFVGANILFCPHLPAFRTIAPHPYLFLIVLMACRYGSNAGLYSAIMGALIHYSWASTSFHFRVFQDFDSVASNCVIFILAGAIIGALQNKVIHRVADLEEKIEDQNREIKVHVKQNEVLGSINEELEEKVFTEVQSFSSLREISESLSSLSATEICTSIPRIICDQLRAEHTTIYLYQSGKLILEAKHSLSSRVRLVREDIAQDESLVGICIKTKKPQCVRDYVSRGVRTQHMQESVMCAPLLGHRNELLGVVNIESMPFMKITESSLNMLSLIAALGGRALATARDFEELGARSIDDEELGLFKRNYLELRLAEEFNRSRLAKHPFSLALIHLPVLGPEQSPANRREEVLMLINYFRYLFRDIGLLSHHSSDILLSILVVDQDRKKVGQMIAQADEQLRQLLPSMEKRYLQIGIAHFDESCSCWEEILSKAERAIGHNS